MVITTSPTECIQKSIILNGIELYKKNLPEFKNDASLVIVSSSSKADGKKKAVGDESTPVVDSSGASSSKTKTKPVVSSKVQKKDDVHPIFQDLRKLNPIWNRRRRSVHEPNSKADQEAVPIPKKRGASTS